jgi:predicted aspartyl protease
MTEPIDINSLKLLIKPDEEDANLAEVLVDGKIGARSYRFLLDTGAAVSQIKSDGYIDKFNYRGAIKTGGTFSANMLSLATVPGITIGPISEKNFTVAIAPIDAPNNLIGMDILKKHNFRFYFDQNKVEVDSANSESDVYRDLTLGKKFHPYIEVCIGKVKTLGIWDTGSGITAVDKTFIRRHLQYFQPIGKSQGTDCAGNTERTVLFQMSKVIIGGQAFQPMKVAALDMSQINTSADIGADLILGYNTLCQSNWFFDFPKKKWAVLPMLADVTPNKRTNC